MPRKEQINIALARVTGHHLAKGAPGEQTEQLRKEVQSAQQRLQQAHQERSKARNELREVRTELREVRTELREARDQLGKMQRERRALTNCGRAWVIPSRYRPILHPGTVIDVGANNGTPELYAAFPDAFHLLIEPMAEHVEDLSRILETVRGDYETVAVGAEPGTAVLNVEPKRGPMSSLLTRTTDTATGDEVERRSVQVRTLDDVVQRRDLPKPFGVKIDTEGYELEVIKGAPETLAASQFVIAECSTIKRFEGGYESVDLIDAMREHGFVVFDVMRSGPRIVDLLFMRP